MLVELGLRDRLPACLYHDFLTSLFSHLTSSFGLPAEMVVVVVLLSFLSGRTSPGSMGSRKTSWSCPVPLKQAAQGQMGTVGWRRDWWTVWLRHQLCSSDLTMVWCVCCEAGKKRMQIVSYLWSERSGGVLYEGASSKSKVKDQSGY